MFFDIKFLQTLNSGIIFREKINNVNNLINDPTKVLSEMDIADILKNELLQLIEEDENIYSKLIK